MMSVMTMKIDIIYLKFISMVIGVGSRRRRLYLDDARDPRLLCAAGAGGLLLLPATSVAICCYGCCG